MLHIKYFSSFKGGFPLVVILGDEKSLYDAYLFFRDQKAASLHDERVAEFVDIVPLQKSSLALDEKECREIARHFRSLCKGKVAAHIYFDTAALGDAAEILISYKEYDDLF